jgi:sec-independent protein translocase protein TatC
MTNNETKTEKHRPRILSFLTTAFDSRKKKKAKESAISETEPLMGHLKKLRHTLIGCLIAIIVCAAVCYIAFRKRLMEIVLWPLFGLDVPVIFTSVPESFTTEMKIVLIVGMIISSPVIFFLIWRFIAPAFFTNEKKKIAIYTISAAGLFCCGVCFSYFIMLPYFIQFFLGTTLEDMKAMLTISNYVDFFNKNLIAFGFVFEMPLVVYFLLSLRIVPRAILSKARKYIFLVCFLLSAIITPPDVLSQILIAAPMYLMYEIGLFLSKITMIHKTKSLSNIQQRKKENT